MIDLKLIIHRCFKILNYHYYYENKYGIKAFNKYESKQPNILTSITIDPKDTFLSFDGLKDKYSLINTPLPKSPHVELMKRLQDNENYLQTEYIKRERNGSLDGRYGLIIRYHEIKYRRSINNIIKEKYEPPKIYQLNNRYYIYDGKHRIALCHILGKKCKCNCIDPTFFIKDKHTQKIYHMMKKRKEYMANIELLEKIFRNK